MTSLLIKEPSTSSGYKYITWNDTVKEWVVRVPALGKRNYLGSFKDIEEAKHALINFTPANLEPLTPPKSRSGVRGIHWHNASGKWVVIPKINGKVKLVGYYYTIEQAKYALDQFLQDGQRWTITPDKSIDITIKSAKDVIKFDEHQLKTWREYLRNLFTFNEHNNMVYRHKFWGKVNRPVRSVRVSIDNVVFTVNKIAYLIHTGHYVKGRIDSLNGDPLDCALDNLRPVHRLDRRFDDKFKSTTFI